MEQHLEGRKEERNCFPRIHYPMKFKNKIIEFIQSMLSPNKDIKLEINSRETVKYPNTWKVKNILLNNSWEKKNVSEVIKIIWN